MKRLLEIAGVCLLLCGAAYAASFPYVTLSGRTNRFADNGTTLTMNGSPLFSGSVTSSVQVVTNLTVIQNSVFNGKVTINTNVFITNGTVFINGTNVSAINPTSGRIPLLSGTNFIDSAISGTASTATVNGTLAVTGASTLASGTVTGNLGASIVAGDTNVVDLAKTAQSTVTNIITAAITFAHATNGSNLELVTKIHKLMVPSGGPYTFTIPSGWRTNVYSAVPPALTNGTITWMYVKCDGPTASSALQTNVYVSFEYYR